MVVFGASSLLPNLATALCLQAREPMDPSHPLIWTAMAAKSSSSREIMEQMSQGDLGPCLLLQ